MRITFALSCLAFFYSFVLNAQAHDDGLSPLPGFNSTWTEQDLAPLEKIIGNAPYIGLGESIHATEGFSQAKFRIIQYLVEKKGVRLLAMETPWFDARLSAKYIADCQGTAKDALKGIFAVWWSQSVADLFEWTCQFNQQHPQDPVRFFGFDVQNSSPDIFAELDSRLKILLPSDSQNLMAGVSRCLGYGLTNKEFRALTLLIVKSKYQISEADQLKCMGGLKDVEKALTGFSDETASWALVDLLSLLGNQEQYFYLTRDKRASYEVRDQKMALTFDAIRKLTDPKGKAVIWAHNLHLALNYKVVNSPYWPGSNSFGYYLRQLYSRDYVPIALTGYKVAFHWPGAPDAQELPQPNSGSVEDKLHQTNFVNGILNLQKDFLTPGSRYEFAFEPIVPSEQFRGIVYLSDCAAMKAP